MNSIAIEVEIEASPRPVSAERIRLVARAVLADHGRTGILSVAVVDDETIHRLNRDFLAHDYPTDCLSFDLSGREGPFTVIGEVVVSAETARREAASRGIPFEEELLRYVVHATLHLCGHDDATPPARRRMRRLESRYLAPT